MSAGSEPRWIRSLVPLVLLALLLAAGCGTEETISGSDNGDAGEPITYFPLSLTYSQLFRTFDIHGDSLGISRYAVSGSFVGPNFTAFEAIDSVPQELFPDTISSVTELWLIESGDTIFQLTPGFSYANRRPLVINHSNTSASWAWYTVGNLGSEDRYSVVWHQRPETYTIGFTTGQIYESLARVDLLAIYELSGDTVALGTRYFKPDVGLIWNSFRPFVNSETFFREAIL